MTAFAELDLAARTEQLEKAVAEIRKIGVEGDKTEAKVKKATDGMSGGMKKLASAAGLVAGSVAALFSINAAWKGAQEVQSITNSFMGMGQSATQAAQSLATVAAIADRTRAPLTATAELYRKVSTAAGELGATSSQVGAFTETIGKALAASGTSANQASGALLQLSQAMAGGVVRAEEFNSILEGAYPIAQAAARGIDEAGGSVGRLRTLVNEGKISSEEFFNAILSQSAAIDAAFGNTVPTVSQAMTDLNNAVSLTAAAFDSSIGISAGFASAILALSDGISFLGENIDTISGIAISASTAFAVYMAPSLFASAAAAGAFVASLVTLKGALLATGIGALVIGAGWLIGKFIELVRHTGGWGNALTLLGEVASGVWEGIKTSATSIPPALNAVWETIKAGFLSLVQGLSQTWAGFLHTITQGMASIPGAEQATLALSGMAIKAGSAVYGFGAAADAAKAKADALSESAKNIAVTGFENAVAAAGKLKAAVEEIPAVEEVLLPTLPGTPGGGGGGGGIGGGGASDGFSEKLAALTQQFKTERELTDQWYEESRTVLEDRRAMEILGAEEHARVLLAVEAELQRQKAELRDKDLEHYESFFGSMAGALASGGGKMLKISKGFALAEATISMYRGAAKALELPFPASLAAWGQVIATGAKSLSGIKSAAFGGSTSGAASSVSAGSTSNREATTAPAQQDRIVRLDVRGEGMFADMLRESGAAIIDAITNESKYGGTTVVLGR